MLDALVCRDTFKTSAPMTSCNAHKIWMLITAVKFSFPCDTHCLWIALPLSYSQLDAFCPQLNLRSEDMKTWRTVRRRILGVLHMPDRQKWLDRQGFKDSSEGCVGSSVCEDISNTLATH
jgi:hypothetical protein